MYRSSFMKQHSENVMVWNYENTDCSFKKTKFIVSFIIVFGTLSFPITAADVLIGDSVVREFVSEWVSVFVDCVQSAAWLSVVTRPPRRCINSCSTVSHCLSCCCWWWLIPGHHVCLFQGVYKSWKSPGIWNCSWKYWNLVDAPGNFFN